MEEHVYPHMYRVEKEHWWFVARLRILLRYLATRIAAPPDTRVLDVGCGTGAILEEFSSRYRASGIDPSPQAVEFCRRRGLTNVQAGMLHELPDERAFDLITMLDVVEHVDDDVGLLREAHRRLVPGGRLLIAVPAFPSLWSKHDEVLHHRRRYTRATLRRAVQEAGFQIEHLTHFNMLLFPVAVLRRIAGAITGAKAMDDLEIPSAPLNRLLARVFALERPLLPKMTLPFGLSLLCLARSRRP